MSKTGASGRWYIEEPREQTYDLLLEAVSGRGNVATLALSRRKGSPTVLPAPLRSHLKSIRPVMNRFGNAGTADVAYLDLSKACAHALRACARAWFEWCLPDLPEDLAVHSGDQILIGAITHEQSCWVESGHQAFAALREVVPSLRVLEGPGFRGGR